MFYAVALYGFKFNVCIEKYKTIHFWRALPPHHSFSFQKLNFKLTLN